MQNSREKQSHQLRQWFSRRNFLKIGLSLSGLISLWGIFRFLSFRDPREPTTQILLDTPEVYPPGSITPVPEVRAWVIRDELGLYALSSVCTHLGCLVIYDGSQFACPCHGSQFDLLGNVLVGPALRPLEYVELSRNPENKLMLNTQVTVTSTQRLALMNQ